MTWCMVKWWAVVSAAVKLLVSHGSGNFLIKEQLAFSRRTLDLGVINTLRTGDADLRF